MPIVCVKKYLTITIVVIFSLFYSSYSFSRAVYRTASQALPVKMKENYLFVGNGLAKLNSGNYDDSYTSFIGIGHEWPSNNISSEIGYRRYTEFEHNSLSNTDIESNGFFINVTKYFQLSRLFYIGPTLELYRWKNDAHLFGRHIGNESGYTFSYGLDSQIQYNRIVGLKMGLKQDNDVSNAKILSFSIGVKISLF